MALYLPVKVSEYLVYLLKACKGTGVLFYYLHHIADLALVNDANEHIFIRVRV